MHHPLVEKGIATLFKELGPVGTIEFLQRLGINEGDTVIEIESLTEKMSKEEIMKSMKKSKNISRKRGASTRHYVYVSSHSFFNFR